MYLLKYHTWHELFFDKNNMFNIGIEKQTFMWIILIVPFGVIFKCKGT